MNEVEKPECSKLADDVTAYAWGEPGDELRASVEAHLKECASCKQFVAFVQEFTATTRENQARPDAPPGSHPEASLIVDLEADQLDEETARQVGLHLLDCKPCREAYLRLRSLTNEQLEKRLLAADPAAESERIAEILEQPERKPPFWDTSAKAWPAHVAAQVADIDVKKDSGQWTELLRNQSGLVIDLAKIYGVGTLLGSIRIVNEDPAIGAKWVRRRWDGFWHEIGGGDRAKTLSKILQFPVGENVYRMKLSLRSTRNIECSVTSFSTNSKVPLSILLWRIEGEQPVLVRSTKDQANLRADLLESDALFGFTLSLEDKQLRFIFRVPDLETKTEGIDLRDHKRPQERTKLPGTLPRKREPK